MLHDGLIGAQSVVRRATLGDQLRRTAARFPEREAIVVPAEVTGQGRRALRYKELNEYANRLAAHLADRGVKVGDVVATMGRNSPELLVVFWAAMKIGAVFTGVNYTFTDQELLYQVNHSGATAVVIEEDFTERFDRLSRDMPSVRIRISNDAEGGSARSGWESLRLLLGTGSTDEVLYSVGENDLAILPYTSGTTALPKAIALPHRNYVSAMIPAYITGLDLLEDDVWYYLLPFHTIAGMGVQIVLVAMGNTMVLPPRVVAANALRDLVDERVSVLTQTPTFFLQLMQSAGFDTCDLSRLRRCITYGGTMPRSMFEAFGKVAPNLVWVTLWSQSELSQTPTIGRFRGLEDIPFGDTAWIGRPTLALEVRVVDPEDRDVGPDVEGELVCRSPGVMAGYYKEEERTSEVLRNGWLHTGDIVRHDGQGNLFFVDRMKDVIKTGGMNVSSVEVERICYQHPDVLEVAVVGLEDPYWSQAVTAFVVPKAGAPQDENDIIRFCKQHLAGYKVPKAVHFVEVLPKDTQGKLLKRELRRLYRCDEAHSDR